MSVKKLSSILIAVCILAAGLQLPAFAQGGPAAPAADALQPAEASPVDPYDPKPVDWVLTGDLRRDLAGIALTQQGQVYSNAYEQKGNDSRISATDNWNKMLIQWCARKAGITEDIIPQTVMPDESHFDIMDASYLPRCGDLVIRRPYGSIRDIWGIVIESTPDGFRYLFGYDSGVVMPDRSTLYSIKTDTFSFTSPDGTVKFAVPHFPAESETYTVSVVNGTGSGVYHPYDIVTAEMPDVTGTRLKGWESDSADVIFTRPEGNKIHFVMPRHNVTATAVREKAYIEYPFDGGTFAGGSLIFDPNSGEIVSGTGSADSLVIPCEIAGIPVTGIRANAFVEGDHQFFQLTIPSGVKQIGDFAFRWCGIRHLTLSEGLETLGDRAFWGNNIANDIVIPRSVRSVGDKCFSINYFMENAFIPNTVEHWGESVFAGCAKLDWGIRKAVVEQGITAVPKAMFSGCGNLREVILPDSLESIGEEAFRACPLSQISLPDSVKQIGGGAFSGSFFPAIPLPASLESLGAMAFYETRFASDSLVLPEKLQSIPAMCFASSNLRSVTIPSSVQSVGEEGTVSPFDSCENLENVIFQDGVRELLGDGLFSGCPKIKAITLPASVTKIGELTFSSMFECPPAVYFEGTSAQWQAAAKDAVLAESLIVIPSDLFAGKTGWVQGVNGHWFYCDENHLPVKGVRYLAQYDEFYIFDENGALLKGDAEGDLPFGGNLYYINPEKDPAKPETCYFVRDYARVRPGVGVTYYNNEGITYVGWVSSTNAAGEPIKLYQTRVNADGEDLYIYVWRAQFIPEWQNPVTGEVTPAGLYLFGDDGVLTTGEGWYRNETWPEGDNMYYALADGTAFTGVRYIDGEFYIFGDDGRILTGDENGDQMYNGNLYYYPEGQRCFARNYARVRPGVGVTYYNSEGITYVGWVSSTDENGNPIRLYQTKVNADGKDLYIYVWRAQFIPKWQNPVTGEVTPAGYYLFGDDGVLITEDGIYECGDGSTYEVKYGVIAG